MKRRAADHDNKWDVPLTRLQGLMLAVAAMTVSAFISITATVLQSGQSDGRQDRDFITSCVTNQRLALVNSIRIRSDAVAFRRTAELMAGVGGSASTERQGQRLRAIGDAFLSAAIAGEVVAEAQEQFASTKCENLPPASGLSPKEVRAQITKEIDRRLALAPRLHPEKEPSQP